MAEADAEQADGVLSKAGLRVEHPPEDWLFKVYTDDAMVDILFRIGGVPVESPLLERASEVEVLSIRMPVLAATDVLSAKLAAMDEHACDLASIIAVARAVREQVEWERLRTEVADNDFAAAALFLLDPLGITGATEG